MDSLIVNLYLRVSTDQQAKEGDSLEEQESELKKFCEFRGFRIHQVLVERGKSGGNTNRPEYQKLVTDIETGKINAVVVKKLDRLSRSLLDFEQLMIKLQTNNVEFISLRENFDTTTAMGKAMLRVALVFAQLEREQTSERIQDVMEYRASKGLYNGGQVPFGYSVLDKELIPYKKEVDVLVFIFDKFLELKSTAAVAQVLNEAKIATRKQKPWIDSQLQAILQNTVYIGQVRWNHQEFEGIHKPLITLQKFEKVQEVFKQGRYQKRTSTTALLKKLLICGHCQTPMTTSFAYNRTKTKYHYYKCTSLNHGHTSRCPIRQVSMPRLDEKVIEILTQLSELPEFQSLKSTIQSHNDTIRLTELRYEEDLKNLNAIIATLKDKKDRFLESLVTSSFLSTERHHINNRIEELNAELKTLNSQHYKQQFDLSQLSDSKIDLSQLNQLAIQFKTDFATANQEEKRVFLLRTLQKIEYSADAITLYFLAIPFSTCIKIN